MTLLRSQSVGLTSPASAKMQCFICVTYMIILCSASPPHAREITTVHAKRSLFRDVIESLRLHAQLPADLDENDNNLSQNDDKFIYETEPEHLPSDVEYIPRRNDRLDVPTLKQRLPKSIEYNESDERNPEKAKQQEVVVYIDTDKVKTTQKPKNKRPRPNPAKIKYPYRDNHDDNAGESETDSNLPFSNMMGGQSQIGNRESQTVLKPTVIVNIRGTVNHRDSEIRLGKQDNDTQTIPQNVFNINQEIKIQRDANVKKAPKVNQEVKVSDKSNAKVEEDMMMCETASWQSDTEQENRKFDNVFQILFNI